MSNKVVTLDVREEIRKGREPFQKILQTVAALHEDENFLLRAPFEPRPLFHVLAGRGFVHQARQLGPGDWEVLFTRGSAAVAEATPASAQSPCGCAAAGKASTIELDVRGLEPPEPLVKILEALPRVPQNARLRAHTDRRPMHLFAQLAERGFTGESEEQKDGSFITTIRHN